MSRIPRIRPLLLATALSVALAACGGSTQQQGMPPAQVGTITVQPGETAIVNELPGRLSATRVAEVRARVPGIVLERTFVEGSEVEEGDVLFRIDPAPLQAEVANAEAAVAQAEADAFQASALARRYEPLIRENAISKQEYDQAVAAQRQAEAQLEAARAQRESARISLNYTTVTAPISGRIGRALVTEGALVGQGDVTPLATVQQTDPMYADVTQSATDLLQLRRALQAGRIEEVEPGTARVTLMLEDGSEYPIPGKLLFSDITVDETTGQVLLRGIFPNPDGMLLPGAYVRVRIEQAVSRNAITIPQQAIQRNSGGQTFVTVVEQAPPAEGQDGQAAQGQGQQPATVAQQRTVTLGGTIGDRWIVESGLQAGDVVIVEGYQRAAPGTPVVASPWTPGNVDADQADPTAQQANPAVSGEPPGRAPDDMPPATEASDQTDQTQPSPQQ